MKIIRSPKQLQKLCLATRRKGRSIGLVPTMGALHEGHLSLVRRARRENDAVVVSIFVNPVQFGPNEDYLRYPRPFAADARRCSAAGVDILFAPSPASMYPEGYATFITVEGMSELLCGAFRPGHFRGVATVVTKLFNLAQPSRAYFGRKDYQQLTIIRRMAADLNLPVAIVGCPIVREKTGLALSSRNQYLSPGEKERARIISRSLQDLREMVQYRGFKNKRKIIRFITSRIQSIPRARIDYVAVCDPKTLQPVAARRPPFVVAVAVWVGRTRLIDNILIP